jgi:uncharacterized protein YfaS (alpha-2-macroglobulin family)
MPCLGETFRILASTTDFDGVELAPDTQEVKIYDPSGSLKATETSPTKKADGLYYVLYTFPEGGAVGTWTVKWKIIKSGRVRLGQLLVSVTSL